MMSSVRYRRLEVALVAVALSAAVVLELGDRAAAQAPAAAPLATQTSSQGAVTVAVKPIALSASVPELRFEIVQDTHSVALSQDMRAVAVLSGGPGGDVKPAAWEGDPPGGHHRKGVLVFAPISPMPESVTLTIRGLGGVPERTFTWAVPK